MPRVTRHTERVLAFLLSDAATPRYAREIAEAVGVPRRTLYPILSRLENAGWLRSELEQIDPVVEGRAARRYVTLTSEGLHVAREALQESSVHLRPFAEPEWGKA